jgi:DNA-3-methyladenine glycosylase
MSAIPDAFFDRSAAELARALIGVTLLVDGIGGIVVETEAYDRDDPASHSFRGLTPRNAAMFGPAGHAYVYRSYGLHWCLNIVAGTEARGGAVLVRALEPTAGISEMQQRRGLLKPRLLCAGPGRLCQALGVTGTLNGLPLDRPPFAVLQRSAEPELAAGPRIGITRGAETPWRFGLAGSAFLSRPFSRGAGLATGDHPT